MNLFPVSEHLHTLYKMWRHPLPSRPELIVFQNQKLRRLVAHAYANVTHYRELFDDASIEPKDIQTVENLHLIPLTSKDDLRTRPLEETLGRGVDPSKLVALKTSGSSGKPFTIRRSPLEEHLINMFRIRARHRAGVRVSDRIARIREMPLGGRKRGLLGRFRQALGIYREYDINCFQPAEDINRELERLRPDVINAYPSSLGYVAASPTVIPLSRIQPRLIITGGELLSPVARNIIKQGFGAPLFDFYGAHEFNLLGWECPKGGVYHICDDNVILEVLREDGSPADIGETGEVVATGLHSYTMPFIRYRTGDIATKGDDSCRCGQPFSTLISIQGRTVDYFCLPGNRCVHPYEISGPLIERESEWISQHQMIQEAEDTVTLRIAPVRHPQPEELNRLKNLGDQKLGPQVKFTIELVESFPLQPGKKFNPYLSMLNKKEKADNKLPSVGLTGGSCITNPSGSSCEIRRSIDRESFKAAEYNPVQYAEFSVPPEAFLVHDPVAVGAFETMEGINDPALLVSNLLFRERPDARLYAKQHRAFVELLQEHAKRVIYLGEVIGDHESFKAVRTNPNQVFTRDSLITIPWIPDGYIPARMAKFIRRSETAAMETAMKRVGLREIVRLPEHLFLEGGDCVPFSRNGRRTLLVGYGQRTRLETLYYLQQTLIPQYADEIIGVELAEWRINLDGGFLPVAEDVIVADVKSIIGGIHIDARTQQKLDIFEMLRELGMKVINVTPDESVFCQACNCLCLGGRKVIYYDLSDRVYEVLRSHDIEVHRTPGSELVKGRGGPRCMTRPIYKSPPLIFEK